jgi:hypothetical protein
VALTRSLALQPIGTRLFASHEGMCGRSPHRLGLGQVVPHLRLASFNNVIHSCQDNPLEPIIKQAKGNRQLNQLRREGLQIERRKRARSIDRSEQRSYFEPRDWLRLRSLTFLAVRFQVNAGEFGTFSRAPRGSAPDVDLRAKPRRGGLGLCVWEQP